MKPIKSNIKLQSSKPSFKKKKKKNSTETCVSKPHSPFCQIMFPLKHQLDYELLPNGKFVLKIEAVKPKDLIVKQARLKIVGDDIWKTLANMLGGAVIASFKLAFHPLYLCSDYM